MTKLEYKFQLNLTVEYLDETLRYCVCNEIFKPRFGLQLS